MQAVQNWMPPSQQPVLWSDWKQLEHQALLVCQATGETYKDAKHFSMPDWFVQRVAKNWHMAKRRYFRLKRANEARKHRAALCLLSELGFE